MIVEELNIDITEIINMEYACIETLRRLQFSSGEINKAQDDVARRVKVAGDIGNVTKSITEAYMLTTRKYIVRKLGAVDVEYDNATRVFLVNGRPV